MEGLLTTNINILSSTAPVVQNQGLNPGIQSRDPGIGIFQSRNLGIEKDVRDGNP